MSLRDSPSPHRTLQSNHRQNTSARGVHNTTIDVIRSFVVLCAPHAAKFANYRATSERSSLKICMVCVNYGDFNRRASNICCTHDMNHSHRMYIPRIDDLCIPSWWGRPNYTRIKVAEYLQQCRVIYELMNYNQVCICDIPLYFVRRYLSKQE
jgi:hypothetical protein